MNKTLIVISGPTAAGKTALSIKLASLAQSVVISCDSRQFYKEMKIGVARPSDLELNTVQHYFIADRSVNQALNAATFANEALQLINQLFNQYDLLIMCGGSGLYIDALLNGLHNLPEANPAIRANLEQELNTNGIEYLQQKLIHLDPGAANRIDFKNPRRLIRALEIVMSSGKTSESFLNEKLPVLPFNVQKYVVYNQRENLYNQINTRVDEMIKMGLEDEALALYHLKHLQPLKTVGYSEFFDFFEGLYSYPETIEKIKQHTRNFAKRQLTWFRKSQSYQWIEPDYQPELLLTDLKNN